MRESFDVVVIGAGITGAATAWRLLERGAGRVLLLDRGDPASGGTGKSAAIVRQHYSTPLMAGLALHSVDFFETLEAEAPGVFWQSGYIMLVPDDLHAAAQANVAMQQGIGVDTRWLDPAEIAERAPWLNPEGVAGVVYEARGGYADPVRATERLVDRFRTAGGTVRLRTPCRALLREGDRITGVLLEDGPIAAGAVVNAAGPWARPLAEQAGIEMPLRAVREQDSIWQARGARPLPEVSISNAVDAIYLRPMGEGRFLIGQGYPKDYLDVDPYNYQEAAEDAFVELMLERATRRFPPLEGMSRITAYAALYDVTPDWYPFIGPRSGLSGYYDACGGSGHGFKIGPAIGRSLADWILDGTTSEAFAALSHDRIGAGRLFVGAYGGNRG
jgi:glycine/D-amino acid oxidase-like deaminating enzyme